MNKSRMILISGALALFAAIPALGQEADQSLVEAGRYLAIAGDCSAGLRTTGFPAGCR